MPDFQFFHNNFIFTNALPKYGSYIVGAIFHFCLDLGFKYLEKANYTVRIYHLVNSLKVNDVHIKV